MARPKLTGPLYLALDQGGASSRAIVFDSDGAIVARAQHTVTERREGEDRVEQDPVELVDSLRCAIAEVAAALGDDAARICAAGLATQRASLVCWDRTSGQPLSPVLSWQDRRAKDRVARLAAHADEVRSRTGLHLSPHYGATKIAWCIDHLDPVRAARDERRLAAGPLASYLVHHLVDEHPLLADPANASRTQLWNVGSGDWDPVLGALFGVPLDVLPRCVPTRYRFGTLRVGAHRVPLSIVTGDQSVSLFAGGTPRPDTAYVNFGTGAFVQRPFSDAGVDAPRLLKSVVMRDAAGTMFVLEGTINGAGSAIHWAEQTLALSDGERHLQAWLDAAASPPLFLNGISGLAAPFWVPDFASRFEGEGSAGDKVAAVAESVVFLMRAILDEMAGVLPAPSQLRLSGGLARVDGLCARLAALAGVPVVRSGQTEGTAAGLACVLGSRPAPPVAETRFEPAPLPALAARYERWLTAMTRAAAGP